MKETTLYICEICKERYADRKEAENCEAAHILNIIDEYCFKAESEE